MSGDLATGNGGATARPRIQTSSPAAVRGIRRFIIGVGKRQYGYVSGIMQILLPDLRVAIGTSMIYNRLHLSKSSAMTRLQREMVATVVNGKIGGAP